MNYRFEEDKNRAAAYDDQQNEVGECTFSRNDECWCIDHTFVEPYLRGQDVASNLVFAVCEQARKENIKIIPACSFAKKEFEKIDYYKDILYRTK